jgi:hypothetical protein
LNQQFTPGKPQIPCQPYRTDPHVLSHRTGYGLSQTMIKMEAFEYKKGRSQRGRRPHGVAILPLPLLVIAFAPAMAGSAAGAQRGEKTIACTNPASGATWEIKIDYDRSTVDANPARVGDAEITWRGLKDGRNYTLDRKSGDLTVIVASSTGGNFLYHRCKLED